MNELDFELSKKKMNWEVHGRNYIQIYIYLYLLKYQFVTVNIFLEYAYFYVELSF